MRHNRENGAKIDPKSIVRAAIEKARDLEPWRDYYRLRAAEMDAIFSICKIGAVGKVLEVGCGNGFVSAILSGRAGEVVASDLMRADPGTHSVGILKAAELFERLGVNNCRVVSCSCEDLPFDSGKFDLVLCAYTLEHVPDRVKALKEVRRVLKDGGRAIFIVPAFMERLLYPTRYYSEIIIKAMKAVCSGKVAGKESGSVHNETGTAGPSGSAWGKFRKSYPYFPMPDTHGEYPGYFSELVRSLSFFWSSLIRKSGFTIKEMFTIGLVPRSFMAVLLGGRSLDLYEKTLWVNKKLGKNALLKHVGENLCFMLEK